MVRLYPFKALLPSGCETGNASSCDHELTKELSVEHHERGPLVVMATQPSFCKEFDVSLKNVDWFMEQGLLIPSCKNSYILYNQRSNGHSQTGVCAVVSLDDYQCGVIKRHEKVIHEKDVPGIPSGPIRKAANVDPIMIMYRENDTINSVITEICSRCEPSLEYIENTNDVQATEKDCERIASSSSASPEPTAEGMEMTVSPEDPLSQLSSHRYWCIDDDEDIAIIQSAFAEINYLYIADGHHRSNDACKYAADAKTSNGPAHLGFAVAHVFADTQLRVLPFHRCITTIGSMSASDFLVHVAKSFRVVELQENEDPRPSQPRHMSMYLDSVWYSLSIKKHLLSSFVTVSDGTVDPVNSLDVQILFNFLIKPVLGIVCEKTDRRVTYVDGMRGVEGLVEEVHSGAARVAFCMHHMSCADIMSVADAGLLMPPKASCFDPKPLSGMLTRLH